MLLILYANMTHTWSGATSGGTFSTTDTTAEKTAGGGSWNGYQYISSTSFTSGTNEISFTPDVDDDTGANWIIGLGNIPPSPGAAYDTYPSVYYTSGHNYKQVKSDGSAVGSGLYFDAGDKIGIEIDFDNNTVKFKKNDVVTHTETGATLTNPSYFVYTSNRTQGSPISNISLSGAAPVTTSTVTIPPPVAMVRF